MVASIFLRRIGLFFGFWGAFLCAENILAQTHGADSLKDAKNVEVSFDNIVLIVFGHGEKESHVRHVSVGLTESVGFSFKENKVLLQALEENFIPTNLLVELASGKLYMYKLVYNNEPGTFLLNETIEGNPNPEKSKNKELKQKKDVVKKKTTDKVASEGKDIRELVKAEKDYFYGIGEIKSRMRVWCGGIWKYLNDYYIKVSMLNKSNVVFSIGGVSIDVTDKGRLKRRVSVKKSLLQSQSILYDDLVVKGKSVLTFVLKIKPITISDDKKVVIDIWENAPGERRYVLTLTPKNLLDIQLLKP